MAILPPRTRAFLFQLDRMLSASLGGPCRPLRAWTPNPDQIWRPGMRDETGARISPLDHFFRVFAPVSYVFRPTVNQLAWSPESRPLYEGLCIEISRIRHRGQPDLYLSSLFPLEVKCRRCGKQGRMPRNG